VLVALAVLAILASLAVPAFTDLIRNGRRTTMVNELGAALMLARAEAGKRAQPVVVCGVTDANGDGVLAPAEQACAGADWSGGWMVAAWNDADADRALDPGELLPALRVHLNDRAQVTVRASSLTDAPATGAVALRPFNQAGSAGRLTVCDPRGTSRARAVELAANGRARVLVNNAEDAAGGVALTCP
jgi:type IV fimbrial biogenesis protein FimT